ncbi:malonyl-ACP O-methyltransferase BioC [Methylophilaceae bacterium]|jgi:malonyl-CoA O-methyltransferase|nr:malonyl-ACP O-methyltransferase BioC [Methylophilaceae bacterium]|tara:strand:- start:1924 stop:2739 length:816 start_codon:yes stop_codon:yes gene_type:complete
MIDKEFKRKAFNRHAKTYDQYSSLQDKISDNLFKKLNLVKVRPNSILDLGCGTGRNGKILNKKFTKIKLINYDFSINMLGEAKRKQHNNANHSLGNNELSYVCGDIEELPFPKNTFDIIWSTSSFQWCNNLSNTFKEIQSILKPGGLFIFSTFGPNTLFELKNITKKISKYQKTNDFIEIKSIKKILDAEGFIDPIINSEEFCLAYKDINMLFLDLKKIGASSGFESKKIGLSSKLFLKLISDGYRKYSYDGIFPATYEALYGYAWKQSDK